MTTSEELCRYKQHTFTMQESPMICRILGHKLNWHNHLFHEDIIERPKPKILYDKNGKEVGCTSAGYVLGASGQPVTNEIIQICSRCHLYFRHSDSKRAELGVVSIR